MGSRIVKYFIMLSVCFCLGGQLHAQSPANVSSESVTPEIGLEIMVTDAGLRDLPDNQFLAGETILVRVRLVNYTALARKAEADRAATLAARVAHTGEELEKTAPENITPLPEIILLSAAGATSTSWSGA